MLARHLQKEDKLPKNYLKDRFFPVYTPLQSRFIILMGLTCLHNVLVLSLEKPILKRYFCAFFMLANMELLSAVKDNGFYLLWKSVKKCLKN